MVDWEYLTDTLYSHEGYVIWRYFDVSGPSYLYTTAVLELAIAIGGVYNNIVTIYSTPAVSKYLPKNWVPS